MHYLLVVGSVVVVVIEVVLSKVPVATMLAFVIVGLCGYMFGLLKLQRFQMQVRDRLSEALYQPETSRKVRKIVDELRDDTG